MTSGGGAGWPATLWLVRHGQSVANAAADAAWAAGDEVVHVDRRDPDVELTALGEQQAAALGAHLAALPPDRRPEHVVVSTYLRARRTAELAVAALGGHDAVTWTVDERLRDRELGVLDRLTRVGIERRWPEEAARRAWLGKYHHRPAGGESWADVALRVRGALADLRAEHAGRRVLLVAHDVVILLCRKLIEGLDEAEILEISARASVVHCGITRFDGDGGELVLGEYNSAIAAPVTSGGGVQGA